MMARNLALALVAIGLGPKLMGPTSDLPAALANYKLWHSLDTQPRAVTVPLSILCAAMPKEKADRIRAEGQRAYGPHAERYVRVFANPEAFAALQDPQSTQFPVGAIIAKEKLLEPHAAQPEGVAFMTKRGSAELAASGGWEFRYYPSVRGASYASCVECHRSGGAKDYVFSHAAK